MKLKAHPALPPRKATTFRLDPVVQERLVIVSEVLKVPLNRLVNEAVREFVRKRTTEVVADMEETLKLLKGKSAEDRDFERAISTFAESEAKYAKEDPTEGQIKHKHGPLQSKVRDLLNA